MHYFQQTVILALPSTDVPLVYQHPSSHLVTSLPYIDGEVDSQTMSQVQKLIQDEMKIMATKDYLSNLRLKEVKSKSSQYFEAEMDRINKGTLLDSVDKEHYKVETFLPPEKENDLNEIRSANFKADGLTQYHSFKLINLELLKKYNKDSWVDYLGEIDTFTKNKEKEATTIKYTIDELNSKRKFEQFQAQDQLVQLRDKINFMRQKNEVLETECDRLENEVRDTRLKKIKTR